jgi:hydrogenase 3 maturation protease
MIVVLGIGNRMRSDDGIGSIIASELKSFRLAKVNVFDCETSPENYLEQVIALRPAWVIFIDACNFGGAAGEFKLFEYQEIPAVSYGLLSTHTLPLGLSIELIRNQVNCRISLLGIQPKSLNFGMKLSEDLIRAKQEIIQFIFKLLSDKMVDLV